ncbi:MAG: hypothetical protein RLZZ574_2853 [Cyanobacteriota bacterium]
MKLTDNILIFYFKLRLFVKKLSISIGLYRPARNLYRFFHKSQLAQFQQEVFFFSKLLDSESLCFDVGANIGEKTEILLKTGARVVAFEPQPDCVREIKARCNHYHSKLHTVESAIGAEPGQVTIYLYERNAHASLYQNWEGSIVQGSIQVPITTLDRAIDEFGMPNYCKIDVEGWELEVLKGLTQPIPFLSFEYHLREREIETTYACINHLFNMGKILINITPQETLSFAFQEWLTPSEFLKLFPKDFQNCDKKRAKYDYGNIWVRSC